MALRFHHATQRSVGVKYINYLQNFLFNNIFGAWLAVSNRNSENEIIVHIVRWAIFSSEERA